MGITVNDTTRLDLEGAEMQLTFESFDPLTKTPELYARIHTRAAEGILGNHQITVQGLELSTNIRQTSSRRNPATTGRDTTRRRRSDPGTERRTVIRKLHEFSHADIQWDFGLTGKHVVYCANGK